MKKKLIILAVLILSCICLLTGCNNKFHAELYDNAAEWIKEEFKNDNRTKGAYYDDEADSLAYTPTRTFIVNAKEDYDIIFADSFKEVDFEKQTVIVHTFTIEYTQPAKIKSIKQDDGELVIDYEIELVRGTGSASQPFQRWFVVTMDKTQISSVTFNENYRYKNY